MIYKHILYITFFNEPETIFCTQLNDFKQVLLFNTNYSIQHYSFVFSLLIRSKYSNISLTTQEEISHLFKHS